MRAQLTLMLMTTALLMGVAEAQTLRERWRAEAGASASALSGGQTMAYGKDGLQTIRFWPGKGKAAPLVIFVHGGGWKQGSKENATGAAKVAHYTGLGYAFASIDYRLVPDATVEEQAQDVADALAYLRSHAGQLDVDPGRIMLMGHSAGAHLVALVGTDMRYFAKAGLGPDAVRGVVALDGAAYDVGQQMAQAGRFMSATYAQAFGTEARRQQTLSPTLQASAPNAPDFLILHVDRSEGTAQAQALADALKAGGTPAQVEALEGRGLRGHMQINRSMGDPAYPGTGIVDAYLARVFAQ